MHAQLLTGMQAGSEQAKADRPQQWASCCCQAGLQPEQSCGLFTSCSVGVTYLLSCSNADMHDAALMQSGMHGNLGSKTHLTVQLT